ncbi:MAG TPA: adenylate/guanylate cyclase domain-containing protein [Candidatus Limnocylindrales bacterium]
MTAPTGPAVTFLFTDIEGSTRLERQVGGGAWAAVSAEHDRRLREAIEAAGGTVVKTEGDAFFAVFGDPLQAVAAIVAGQRAIAAGGWPEADGLEVRVRAGLHLGEGRLRDRRTPDEPPDYVGIDVNYAARIAAAGNGGQIVLSDATVRAMGTEIDRLLSAAGGSLLDEGLRTVKDFDEPTRLHRLVVPGVADDARPLRTLDAPTNLPHAATSLVGREDEIDVVAASLATSRIVTLTGPGGSGKTRLAIGVAESVRSRFPHGTWFVDLAAVRDPALLDAVIAAVIGVPDSGGRSTDESVRAFLSEREVLLLLDNLEQLLPDAAAEVAALARGTSRLRLLLTSRELLRINGEHGYSVPPLDLESGVRLFEERARAQRPDLVFDDDVRTTIRAICERLGGLPLAIELAAARSRLYAPAAILERLSRSLDLAGGARDVPERQRTLRAAIDWSHDLLSTEEQRLFRRLGVFAGGWTPEDAASVVDADGDLGIDLLAGLESLVDKSLVRVEMAGPSPDLSSDEPRFSIHPLLREYALERLAADADGGRFEARHAAVFTENAERAGAAILGPGGQAALHRLDLEQHNLRAAIDWSLRTDEILSGLRIAAATWRWFQQRGRLREGRGILADLLGRPQSMEDARLRIAALAADGGLAYWMEDMDGSRGRYVERLVLADSIGDARLVADANYDIGFLYMVSEEGEQLRLHEQRALDLYVELGDERGAALARQALALVEFLARDYAAARDREEESLAFFRKVGAQIPAADSLMLLAAIHTQLGDGAAAWERVTECLRVFAERDLASGLARSLGMAAIVQHRFGDPELGARIGGAALELARQKNVMVAPTTVLHLPDQRAIAEEHLGTERAEQLLAEGAATPIETIIAAILATPNPAFVVA